MSETKIVDKCPSCGSTGTLFIGAGGYLTCSLIGCPQPGVGRAIAQLRAELDEAKKMIDLAIEKAHGDCPWCNETIFIDDHAEDCPYVAYIDARPEETK